MKYNASELANWLANHLPEIGYISRLEAKRLLCKIKPDLSDGQFEQVLILAKSCGYVKFGYGGVSIRKNEIGK